MSHDALLPLHNAQAIDAAECPVLPVDAWRTAVIDALAHGGRLAALCGMPCAAGAVRLLAVVALPEWGHLGVVAADVGDSYPALTPDCPQAHWFEREIAEQWCVRPAGHPWLKPVRFEEPRRAASAPEESRSQPGPHPLPLSRVQERGVIAPGPCGVTDFFAMHGNEVHEVAVGPVHAGIIEPGHFRFQCHGETVYHLEISLGYQHRGIERALVEKPAGRAIHYMETAAGDTSAAQATAWCRNVEALSRTRVPARAQVIRGLAMELERVANHVGDLGALAGDVGFLPTLSYCGRIRGDVLNLTGLLCGNRFGRGLVRPGGVAWDLDPATLDALRARVPAVLRDVTVAAELLWDAPSVTARFDQTGTIPRSACRQLGLVGVAARACGLECDVRSEFPYGIYRFVQIPVSTWHTGDVFARAYVRWLEIQRSLAFVAEQLQALPDGGVREAVGPLGGGRMAVSLVEGWRGELCHVAVTGDDGSLAFYKIVDPSLHNWFGLAYALRDQQISDFPLCNKSFNLSYCGHDL